MKRVKRWVLGAIHPILVACLPRNRTGDYLYNLIDFVYRHRRLPRRDSRLFNDHLFFMKVTDEILNPLRTFISDKEHVKTYVRAVVGDQYNVPTLAVLHDDREIDGYAFPADCCIKPTHASGRVMLRTGNAPVDREKMKRWLRENYYEIGRQANYKYLKPKVIVEEIVFSNTNAVDWKFFCYNGRVIMLQIDFDRYTRHTRKYFDRDFAELDFSIIYPRNTAPIDPPGNLGEMIEVAEALSADFSVVRVDLYSDGERCYVGEITNCTEAAGGRFRPPEAETRVWEMHFGGTRA